MKKVCLVFLLLFLNGMGVHAQAVAQRLAATVKQFQADPDLETALIGISIVDMTSGEIVYEKNSSIAMAPASTQKLFTAAAMFAMFGPGYQYETTFRLHSDSRGQGYLNVLASGDPSFGSWRFAATKAESILNKLPVLLKMNEFKAPVNQLLINGTLSSMAFRENTIPDGYIWQDIGNYYGSGSLLMNWRENQYDIIFDSKATGSAATIEKIQPEQPLLTFMNDVRAGTKGSGDNAYIYCPPYGTSAYIKGTIPPSQKGFTISGSMPNPVYTFRSEVLKVLQGREKVMNPDNLSMGNGAISTQAGDRLHASHSFHSPSLDTLIYWFLRKSINLYGEAFVKTIGMRKGAEGSFTGAGYQTEAGLKLIRAFWTGVGIDNHHLQMIDGSGLSPQNRITARAFTNLLGYAARQPWYRPFHHAIPVFNGMKMKSGSISGTRAYAGYHQAKNGRKYCYAVMVNNFTGPSSDISKGIWKILDVLK